MFKIEKENVFLSSVLFSLTLNIFEVSYLANFLSWLTFSNFFLFLTKYWTTILPYEFLFTLTISINIIFFSILTANHLADWLHFKTQSAVFNIYYSLTV